MDREDLADRLAAVERRLTDGETDCRQLADDAALVARVDELEDRAEAVDERLAEVESAVQALRGYVGGIERVNEDVERRANAAVARVERLEEQLDGPPEERPESTDDRGDDAERAAAAARGVDVARTAAAVDPVESDADRSLTGRMLAALS
jgi:chromosome segregation ATPase